MYKVILAGGMASGKSTVSKMFEAAGGLRFDLDEVSRRLLRPGCECTYRVAEAFGNDLLDPVTHEINRRELGRRAFATSESVEILEDLEMPFIREYMRQFLTKEAPTADAQFCFVEVPLLDRVEVVVVVAPLELRAERAEQRGSSRQEFEQRIAHQPSDTYLRNQADTVFVNSEGLDDLKAQVELWLNARFNQHSEQ